jgi:mannose-1-phosphate guanylyltransferase
VKAVLLAAGLGTRLRPLTDTTPKCLVRVGERTLLDIWLDAFDDAGVEHVLVNTHHLADQVEEQVGRRTTGPRVTLVHEERLRGSAGTLRAARGFVEGERFFLAVNADNLTDFDLRRLVETHARSGLPATLAAFHPPQPTECGIFEVGENGVLEGFEEKPDHPRGDLANAGLYAFSPSVLDLVDLPDPADIGTHLLPRLVGLAGVLDIRPAYLADIGTPQALADARSTWRQGAHR